MNSAPLRPYITVLCIFSVCLFFYAPAQAKDNDHVGKQPAWDSREGGETIADAIEVQIPFYDSGATCDNINDYDEICPFIGSVAPDVVYTFTAEYDEYFDVDLQGSDYDTKVYIYDSALNVVACNDDYYPDYTSKIEMFPALAGETYYLVIDGYAEDCGWYQVFTSCMPPPCIDAQCPPVSFAEGEPAPGLGYVDTFNGGCDAETPAFQDLVMPAGLSALNVCGYTGWYERDGETHRDSDWYVMTATGSSIFVGAESAHFLSVDVDVMFLQDCQDISLLPYQAGICEVGEIEVETYPGQVVFLRVRPTAAERQGCAPPLDLYTLQIMGIEGPVQTESAPWGSVKSYYR